MTIDALYDRAKTALYLASDRARVAPGDSRLWQGRPPWCPEFTVDLAE
jgi:hypothetical protein